MVPDLDVALIAALVRVLGHERLGLIAFGGIWPNLNDVECAAIAALIKAAIRNHWPMSNATTLLCFKLFCALWINGTMSEPPRCT